MGAFSTTFFPILIKMHHRSVTDSGFPRGGGTSYKDGSICHFFASFSKNCMKMKKVDPEEGMHSWFPLASAKVDCLLTAVVVEK